MSEPGKKVGVEWVEDSQEGIITHRLTHHETDTTFKAILEFGGKIFSHLSNCKIGEPTEIYFSTVEVGKRYWEQQFGVETDRNEELEAERDSLKKALLEVECMIEVKITPLDKLDEEFDQYILGVVQEALAKAKIEQETAEALEGDGKKEECPIWCECSATSRCPKR